MILFFLGSWRSTLIIAVSILASVIMLSLLSETINTITLGGLALPVVILVDDETVTIENIEGFLENGYPLREAILDGAAQIAVPARVSTLCICIVFSRCSSCKVCRPICSLLLRKQWVPTLAMYLLRVKMHGETTNPFARFQRGCENGFERV